MGNDGSDEQFDAYFTRISNSKIGIVSQFSDEDYAKLVAMGGVGHSIRIEQRGPWPEFLFKGGMVLLDLDGKMGQWLVEDVSVAGVTLRRVT